MIPKQPSLIAAGYKLFKNEEKRNGLNQWCDKVFASEVLTQRYDKERSQDVRNNILRKHSGIANSKIGKLYDSGFMMEC